MSIKDAFNRALESLKLKSKLIDEKSSSSSSSSNVVRKVPRYPTNSETTKQAIDKVFEDLNALTDEEFEAELTHAQKAEQEIKEYFVPKHLRDYAQDVRDHVAAKNAKKEEPKKYDKDKCDPKTCWGECMGEGWCHIAQEWHKVMHRHQNFNAFVKLKKVKGKMSKKKRKALKRKWQQRHNR
jgi:hypothetical protein